MQPSWILRKARVRPEKAETERGSKGSPEVLGGHVHQALLCGEELPQAGDQIGPAALPRTISASKRAAAASGKAWGMQPVSTATQPGFSRLVRRRAWRTLWSLWAVTVQELTTTTPAGSAGEASV